MNCKQLNTCVQGVNAVVLLFPLGGASRVEWKRQLQFCPFG